LVVVVEKFGTKSQKYFPPFPGGRHVRAMAIGQVVPRKFGSWQVGFRFICKQV
jgi:hypothetical protein